MTSSAPAETRDPYGLTPIINSFRFDGVEATVVWRKCGVVNAYYYISTRTVVLCNELKKLPAGVIRYILAHELSHAVIYQRNIAYTGSGEWAADELAAFWLIVTGHSADVIEGAEFWMSFSRNEDPWDDHPGDVRRALNLACMVWTRDEAMSGCNTQYARVVSAWIRLLGIV